MIKYYEVVEVLSGGIVEELVYYRGYDFKSAKYCFEKNSGDLELREYIFKKQYEIDFENEDYVNAIINGGEKCGYDLKSSKRARRNKNETN